MLMFRRVFLVAGHQDRKLAGRSWTMSRVIVMASVLVSMAARRMRMDGQSYQRNLSR